MGSFLLRVETVEARVLPYSCPRGTSGRLHSLRLKRRFQRSAYPRNADASKIRRSPVEDNLIDQPSRQNIQGGQLQDVIGKIRTLGLGDNVSHRQRPIASWKYTYEAPKRPPKYRGIAKHTARAGGGGIGGIFYDHPKRSEGNYTVPQPNGDYKTNLARPTIEELYEAIQANNPRATYQFATRLGPYHRIGQEEEFRQLPDSKFSELFSKLHPYESFRRYGELYKEITPYHRTYEALFDFPRLTPAFREPFMQTLNGVVKFRLAGGHHLSLSDCRHFLRCARAVRDQNASETMWKLMENSGISPDTACYNHYMAVMVRSDTLMSTQRRKVRVTPTNLEVRQWSTPPIGYDGYRVGDNGLKHHVTLLFDKMVASGVVADEQTMCHVMLAFAKEGDINGAKNILNKIWGIHVEKLLAFGEEGMGFDFPADSPTRPSNRLLRSLAYAFGINNSIPIALRLIDFISRRYSLDIPNHVWEELLERTFVLSTPKSQKHHRGFEEGMLPVNALDNLWATITAKPYNVVPTIPMYDMLIRNLFRQQRWGQAEGRMEEARTLHMRVVAKYGRLVSTRANFTPQTPSQTFEKLDSDIAFLSLRVHRNRQYIREWCRQIIKGQNKSLSTIDYSWRGIHRVVERWNLYLPRIVKYETSTGTVRFPSGSRAMNSERVRRFEALGTGNKQTISPDDLGRPRP